MPLSEQNRFRQELTEDVEGYFSDQQQAREQRLEEEAIHFISEILEVAKKIARTPDDAYSSEKRFYRYIESEYNDDGDLLGEEDFSKDIKDIPRQLQPYVFSRLWKLGYPELALDLIMLGKISHVGQENIKRVLSRTQGDEEKLLTIDNQWIQRSARGAKKTSLVDCYEKDIPFFWYVERLEDRIVDPKATAFAGRYGSLDFLPKHLAQFPHADRDALALRLEDAVRPDVLAEHLQEFPQVNHRWLFDWCLENGMTLSVSENAAAFQLPEHEKINRILAKSPSALVHHLDQFSPEYHHQIFLSLLQRHEEYLKDHVWRFALDKDWMAREFLSVGEEIDFLAMRWFSVTEAARPIFSRDIANRLLEKRQNISVIKYERLFIDVDLEALVHSEPKILEPGDWATQDPRILGNYFSLVRRLRGYEAAMQATEATPLADARFYWLTNCCDELRDRVGAAVIEQHREKIDDMVAIIESVHEQAKPRTEAQLMSIETADLFFRTMLHASPQAFYWEEWLQVALEITHETVNGGLFEDIVKANQGANRLELGRMLLERKEFRAIGKAARLFAECGLAFAREAGEMGCQDIMRVLVRLASEEKIRAQDVFSRKEVIALCYPDVSGKFLLDGAERIHKLQSLKLIDEDSPLDSDQTDVWNIIFDEKIPLVFKKEPGMLDPELSGEARRARSLYEISPREYEVIRAHTGGTKVFANDTRSRMKQREEIFFALVEAARTQPTLGMGEDILWALERGGEVFGAGYMMIYMNRPGVSRHDMLFFMQGIIRLQEQSKLAPEAFAKNILLQVMKDGAHYPDGSSYHEFKNVCQELSDASFDPMVEDSVPAVLAKYRDQLPEVGELLDAMQAEGPFSSWKNLRKACEAYRLSRRTELLDQLQGEPSRKMREYVTKLAFHPNISMEAVFQFWNKTEEFLGIDDEHAPRNLSAAKKPANYLSVAHLGLKAVDLRNALVGRDHEPRAALDRLQTMPALARGYTVVERPELDADQPVNLHRFLLEALGRPREGVRGKAKDPKKLFASLGRVLASLNLETKVHATILLESPLAFSYLKKDAPEIYAQLKEEIFHRGHGMIQPDAGRQTFRARIGWKSDPEMVVAGNDTASCMPFGSGKNNVYSFNPNCVQFVVERQASGDKWRTIAQSVVTINQETSQAAPDLMKLFQAENAKVENLIREEDFTLPRYIACDNIEVAKNGDAARSFAIADVYKKFWSEYLALHATELGVADDKVVAGQGYSPADLGLETERNNTVPLVPMTYSDNLYKEHLVIPIEKRTKKSETLAEKPSLRPIAVTDVYSVAHLESKAFADTQLGYGIHKIQNNLLGIAIANQLFDRPNLSFISQAPGKPASAYLIAYEGEIENEKMIYVDDMAAESKGHPAGGRVLLAFVDAYLAGYRTKPAYPPIIADMRDSTSFKLVTNQLGRLSQRAGLKTRLVNLSTSHGAELMHKAAILVGHDEEDLNRQEQRVRHLTR